MHKIMRKRPMLLTRGSRSSRKKAIEVFTLVTKGSAILKTLEKKGEAKLYRLKVV